MKVLGQIFIVKKKAITGKEKKVTCVSSGKEVRENLLKGIRGLKMIFIGKSLSVHKVLIRSLDLISKQ